MKKDVVIIGGGIIGLCSAYYLWKEGKSVTVIDKGEIGMACSYGNAGYITPSHFIPLSAPGMISKGLKWMFNPESPFYIKPQFNIDFITWLWKFNTHCTNNHIRNVEKTLLNLNLESMKLYKELSELTELNFQYSPNGLLMLYNTEKGLEEEGKVVQEANRLGLKAEMLSKDEIKMKEPNIDFNIVGGSYYPEDGHIHPFEFISSLKSFLLQQGVEFKENSEVTDFDITKNAISSVTLGDENIEANEFVLATGSWSNYLGKKLKLKIPVQAGKGYSFTLDKQWDVKTSFILTEGKVAVTPLGEKIRFGGTMELGGMNETVNSRRINGIKKSVIEFIPDFDDSNINLDDVWYGFRPCSPDGVPFIGRSKSIENLVVSTGHAMMGLSLGPISGKIVTEIICGKETTLPLEHLQIDRFE